MSTLPPMIFQQFVDDTIISTQSLLPQEIVIKEILEDYKQAVGHKVNFGQSKLIFINTYVAMQFGVVRIFGCGIKDFSIVYLSMLLFKGRMKEEYQNLVMDHLSKKLVAWKGALLIQAGKYQLLQLVLQSIPMYFLSIFKIPAMVRRNIE